MQYVYDKYISKGELALEKFSLGCVCTLQGACVKKLEGKGKVKDSKATKQLVALLSAPLEKYKDVVVVLKLSNYARVMEHLDYETNKVMTVVLIQSILSNSTMISAPDKVTVYYYPVATMCSFPLKPCTFFVLTMGVFSFVIKGGCSIWATERAYSR